MSLLSPPKVPAARHLLDSQAHTIDFDRVDQIFIHVAYCILQSMLLARY